MFPDEFPAFPARARAAGTTAPDDEEPAAAGGYTTRTGTQPRAGAEAAAAGAGSAVEAAAEPPDMAAVPPVALKTTAGRTHAAELEFNANEAAPAGCAAAGAPFGEGRLFCKTQVV